MKAKIFDVSRRAAGKLREPSSDKVGGMRRHHTIEGSHSVRAEFDAIRTNFRARGIASTRAAAVITVAESRQIIEQNSLRYAPRHSNSCSASRREGKRNSL